MKKLILAAALTAVATNAFAGSLADAIVEAPPVVDEAAASSFSPMGAGVVAAGVLGLAALALIASNDDTDETNGTNGTNGTN